MAKTPALPSAWSLFRTALAQYRKHWLRYSVIVGVVVVPVSLINLMTGLANDSSILAYTSLASLMMNVAILWAITRPDTLRRQDWLSSVYYDSSAALLRFVLVALGLAVSLLPVVLGLLVYSAGVTGGLSTPALGERLIIAALALLVASPSFWLITRFGLALIVVTSKDQVRPMTALKIAWRLTHKRAWQVVRRFVGAFVLIVLLLLVPSVILIGLASVTKLTALVTVFQIIATLIALPLLNLIAFNLYLNLAKPKQSDNESV